MIREAGLDAAVEGFIQSQCWGTPDQMIEKYKQRIELVGDIHASMAVSYAGMPFDLCSESLALIGREVAPRLRKLEVPAGAPA